MFGRAAMSSEPLPGGRRHPELPSTERAPSSVSDKSSDMKVMTVEGMTRPSAECQSTYTGREMSVGSDREHRTSRVSSLSSDLCTCEQPSYRAVGIPVSVRNKAVEQEAALDPCAFAVYHPSLD